MPRHRGRRGAPGTGTTAARRLPLHRRPPSSPGPPGEYCPCPSHVSAPSPLKSADAPLRGFFRLPVADEDLDQARRVRSETDRRGTGTSRRARRRLIDGVEDESVATAPFRPTLVVRVQAMALTSPLLSDDPSVPVLSRSQLAATSSCARGRGSLASRLRQDAEFVSGSSSLSVRWRLNRLAAHEGRGLCSNGSPMALSDGPRSHWFEQHTASVVGSSPSRGS